MDIRPQRQRSYRDRAAPCLTPKYSRTNQPPSYAPGTREDELQREAIAQEHRSALADLLEIMKKYDAKLKNATWNRNASKPQPGGDDPKPSP